MGVRIKHVHVDMRTHTRSQDTASTGQVSLECRKSEAVTFNGGHAASCPPHLCRQQVNREQMRKHIGWQARGRRHESTPKHFQKTAQN